MNASHGQRLQLLGHVGGQSARDDQLGRAVLVLVVVVVELGAGHDLAGQRRPGVEVAEHGALDLAADDGLLDDQPLVVARPLVESARSSSRSWALVTPTDEPMLAGFTNIGKPSSSARRRDQVGVVDLGLVEARPFGLGDALAANTSLALALSMARAEASTPQPT